MDNATTRVALDDGKHKIVAGILRPEVTQPELRELPNDPHHIWRFFGRLKREGAVVACYEGGVGGTTCAVRSRRWAAAFRTRPSRPRPATSRFAGLMRGKIVALEITPSVSYSSNVSASSNIFVRMQHRFRRPDSSQQSHRALYSHRWARIKTSSSPPGRFFEDASELRLESTFQARAHAG